MRKFTIVLLIIVVFLLWNSSIVTAQFLEAGVQKLASPIKARNFTLKALEGRKISLKGLRGRIVILTFFSPLCSVCQGQSSSFDKLAEEIKNKEAVLLLVASRVKEKELVKYKKEFHISIPILVDRHGSVSTGYGVYGCHETFFINREGKIVGKTFAEKDWTSESMRNLIEHLLREGG